MITDFATYSFKNKKVIVRVDFNVPFDENFNVTDETRITSSLPTIQKIINDGGIPILISHLGRPKGIMEKFSLKHLIPTLQKYFKAADLFFMTDCIGDTVKAKIASLLPRQLILLENLRFYKEEEAGDEEFAKSLASLGDVYVNDAFGTAHRAHASTTIMAHYFEPDCKMFGYLMNAEVINATKVLNSQDKPFTAILGGAKVSDKILIIENLLDKANNIIIGGGMAYTFIKALGGEIGLSICELDKLDLALNILQKAKEKNVQIILPVDTMIADKFDNNANTDYVDVYKIPSKWEGLDIGLQTRIQFSEIITQSKTILWNGPMGVFEMPNFQGGTKAIAEAIAQATKNGAFSLVGGGDSVSAVNQFGYNHSVSYISTGGGALLEFMEGQVLPGIQAMEQ